MKLSGTSLKVHGRLLNPVLQLGQMQVIVRAFLTELTKSRMNIGIFTP